jgi:hypothetical protein
MDESYRLTAFKAMASKPPKSLLWPDLKTYGEWCDRQVMLMWARGKSTARVHVELVNGQKFCCVVER